jgi:hypothetical protein
LEYFQWSWEGKQKKKKRGERGADVAPRAERRCMDCVNSGIKLRIDKATECNGRWPRGKCTWNLFTGG